ncbi:MAG: radical SAM protein [Myxococcota bacterium]|nr:radical SAM protein [Myxococcota bacterium]
MRLLLVSLDWLRDKDPRVSLGHGSLLARLQQVEGLEVLALRRAVNAPGFERRELLGAVVDATRGAPADLAIGVYVWNDPDVRWLIRQLREQGFAGRILLGGPQISYAPAGIARVYPEADVLIRGYGEDALAQVLLCEEPQAIPGVVWREGLDLGMPAQVALEALPSPLLTGVLPVQAFMRWETQRGCQYRCSFCQHREAGARLQRSTLSAGRIADEIEALVQGGARDIAVLDPIFNSNPDAAAILRRFSELGYTGRLSLQARFELLNDDFLDAAQRLDVQLEFGLQTVQRAEMKAVQRINNLPKVAREIEGLHRRGIPFEVSLIYGLPNQTLASFQESVRWCLDRGVPVVKAFPLMLLRGTKLERERERWGLVESAGPIPVVVESDSFTRAEWEQMRELAESLMNHNTERGAA